jgi:hypothetical protein
MCVGRCLRLGEKKVSNSICAHPIFISSRFIYMEVAFLKKVRFHLVRHVVIEIGAKSRCK